MFVSNCYHSSLLVVVVFCLLLLFVCFFFEYRYVIQNMQSGFVKTYVCLLLIVYLKEIVTVL